MTDTIPAEIFINRKVKIFLSGHPLIVYSGIVKRMSDTEIFLIDKFGQPRLISRASIRDLAIIPELPEAST